MKKEKDDLEAKKTKQAGRSGQNNGVYKNDERRRRHTDRCKHREQKQQKLTDWQTGTVNGGWCWWTKRQTWPHLNSCCSLSNIAPQLQIPQAVQLWGAGAWLSQRFFFFYKHIHTRSWALCSKQGDVLGTARGEGHKAAMATGLEFGLDLLDSKNGKLIWIKKHCVAISREHIEKNIWCKLN